MNIMILFIYIYNVIYLNFHWRILNTKKMNWCSCLKWKEKGYTFESVIFNLKMWKIVVSYTEEIGIIERIMDLCIMRKEEG